MKPTSILKTCAKLERQSRQHLKNALLDGQYILERATDFWSRRDADDCLAGERKLIGSDVVCSPLRFNGSALLVYLVDSHNQTWFAWIHA